ncbi:hypothetical protein V6N12_008256 [Hibiscus sabdariffa]|uniref:Uncharacterized protein n=1 Tax=Hibiscus sabdariffa TaxID=183260 RepID=A0ABR2B4M1_9ROSI
MRGTGNKLTDHGSAKSYSSKREAGSKLIATLKFKHRCKISHGRVRKPKHHVKKVGSTLLKRKVTSSVTKGPGNDVSSSRKVDCKTNLHKAIKKGSSKKLGSSKLRGKNATCSSLEENGKKANADVRIKNLTKKKKKGQKDKVELDEASRLQRRTRYLLIKMKLEQNLIDAYSGEGWKGQSREKIKPEKELQRAKKQILKCKLGIREAIRQLDSLSSVGSIEGSVIAPDGSVYHEHIFCAKCKLREAFPDNDIVLCDGTCNRAFHQKCLDPPLDTENIPPGDQGWFCKFCECKMAIIEAMNAHIGTHFSVDSHWQDIFKDEAALPDDAITSLNLEVEWPSDDSEDDDYDPERRENSCRISGTASDGEESDDTDSSTGLTWSVDSEDLSGFGRRENHPFDCGADSYETSDGEIVCGRRRRGTVDYKKLYDEMFGKDDPQYERVSEDEDWGPGKRKHREKESDAASTLMTLYESETKFLNDETTEMKRQLSSDLKSRRPFFRIPPSAVEKLRQVFAENELPSRVIREKLSKELSLEPEKVNKWFKNARYLALKSRKVEKADHLQSSSPRVTKEPELEAPKGNDPDIMTLEDMSETALLRTPKRLKKKPRESPNSKSNSNKVSKELSDDVILKKLLNVKKKKRKNIFVGGGLQAFELEMERLCRAKVRLENMKQTLLRLETRKGRKLNKRRVRQESVIYIPIAELKEKILMTSDVVSSGVSRSEWQVVEQMGGSSWDLKDLLLPDGFVVHRSFHLVSETTGAFQCEVKESEENIALNNLTFYPISRFTDRPPSQFLCSYYSFLFINTILKLRKAQTQIGRMAAMSWPTQDELHEIRKIVCEMSGKGTEDVRVVVSPYRICPLGAHVDHQGGIVSAMTINKGILLGFVPSGDTQVTLQSGQFKGEVRFRVNQTLKPRHTISKGEEIKVDNSSQSPDEFDWGKYARGALYALQSRGNNLAQGIIGYICGSEGLDSSGLSSSAAVGIAYLLALESANSLTVSPTENIEYDRVIENEYLGLRNGIMDQSAILLSSRGCLTYMNCKTKEHKLIDPPKFVEDHEAEPQKGYKILLAFSGLRQALTSNPGYNSRVAESQEAAKVLLRASGNDEAEPFLCNVKLEAYEAYKFKLEPNLAKRAEHYFSENMRVAKGLEAWASGELRDFGELMTASGLSSIKNYECGCEPLIQLYEVLLRAPGVFGARFSGAGFRGCCVALVDAACASEAANFVKEEYSRLQPVLASQLSHGSAVMICEAGDCARVI